MPCSLAFPLLPRKALGRCARGFFMRGEEKVSGLAIEGRSRFDRDLHRLDRAMTGLAERTRQGLRLALLIDRPAAEGIFAGRQCGQQGSPVDLAQLQGPGPRPATGRIEACRALGNLVLRQTSAPSLQRRQQPDYFGEANAVLFRQLRASTNSLMS